MKIRFKDAFIATVAHYCAKAIISIAVIAVVVGISLL